MTAQAHFSSSSCESFSILGNLSRAGDENPPTESAGLATVEASAFTADWARVQLSVRAYLNSFLSDRSAIDDCVQEVALLAWKKGPRQATPDAFMGFCIACAKRIAMSEVRKKYRTRLRSLAPDIVQSLADTVATQELEEESGPVQRISALQSCLEALDPEPRRLLELRYSSTDSAALQREASATGRSLDAIYKKLERLRTLLRQCVAGKSLPQE